MGYPGHFVPFTVFRCLFLLLPLTSGVLPDHLKAHLQLFVHRSVCLKYVHQHVL